MLCVMKSFWYDRQVFIKQVINISFTVYTIFVYVLYSLCYNIRLLVKKLSKVSYLIVIKELIKVKF